MTLSGFSTSTAGKSDTRCDTMAQLRSEVLHLYKRILRVGNAWEATNPHETVVEREYILDETKTLFRKNRFLNIEAEVKERLLEAETRLTMAEHYRNPYPRPVNLPRRSFARQLAGNKPVGKAFQKINELSRPVYIRSTDDAVRRH